MFNKPQLTVEWANWIKTNLANGCTVDSMAKIMVEKGFAPEFAYQSIFDTKNLGVTPMSPIIGTSTNNTQYVYEKPRVPMDVNYIDTPDKRVYIGMKMNKPVIMTFTNLLSHEEADVLINASKHKLTDSKVVDPDTGHYTKIRDRSSEGTFFNYHENEFITKLEQRIAFIMGAPAINGEGIQILHYHPGGEYKAHFDYFPYDQAGSKRHLNKGGQRISTLIMYLSDVEQGGETTFPEVGLTVVPNKGGAVYFEYCNSKSQVDPLTLHAGMPVIKGEKWIATKWVRQNKYN
jgi:prolyl 4-hydroxylase